MTCGLCYDGSSKIVVRLNSCLEELRNILGDSTPEHVMVDAVLKQNFDFQKSLNAILNTAGKKFDG